MKFLVVHSYICYHTGTYVCVCTLSPVCVFKNAYVSDWACACARVCACVRVCMCVCVCIRFYMHIYSCACTFKKVSCDLRLFNIVTCVCVCACVYLFWYSSCSSRSFSLASTCWHKKASFEPSITALSSNSSYQSRVIHEKVMSHIKEACHVRTERLPSSLSSLPWVVTPPIRVDSHKKQSCQTSKNHVTYEQKDFLWARHHCFQW